jgi:pyrroloquinoline quinone biosynthesis protein B
VLWLPDIDSWDGWDVDIVELIASVDVAYVDGTFFDDGELERDMSAIPHPRIVDTVRRVADLDTSLAARVRFVHLNHTNPALVRSSSERATVVEAGMLVADEGETVPL